MAHFLVHIDFHPAKWSRESARHVLERRITLDLMEFEFDAELFEWRGPAPFVFAPLPKEISELIKDVSGRITYGWGVIPVTARVGGTTFSTSLFPKDGVYLLPIKAVVQRAESVGSGDVVAVALHIGLC